MSQIISVNQLIRHHHSGEQLIRAVDGVSFSVEQGEFVSIVGASGSGKSTLLSLLAGLERADSGEIWVDGQEIHLLSEAERVAFRREKLGFVFQSFQLFPHFSALENVLFPLELSSNGRSRSELVDKASQLLEQLGLGDRLNHFPAQLSGGEQQRVAIARAIATRPRILLADEPTGNLDSSTSEKVIATLFEATKSAGAALVLVTHDADLAERCERVLTIEDGRIVDDRKTKAGAP